MKIYVNCYGKQIKRTDVEIISPDSPEIDKVKKVLNTMIDRLILGDYLKIEIERG